MSRVAAELIACRQEAGVSQPKLAERAGVHRNSISDIERLFTMPSADMLRKLANGLATYAPGRRDAELAESYYQRLLRAAGYLDSEPQPAEPERPRPVEDLTDEEVVHALESRLEDRELAVRFLSVATHWRQMSPSARRAVLNSLDLADQFDEDLRRAEERLGERRPRS